MVVPPASPMPKDSKPKQQLMRARIAAVAARMMAEDGIEDFALAKKIKESGLNLRVVDPSLWIESKMYESFSEIWHGYSKNLFKALGSSYPILLIFIAGFTMLYILPFYFLSAYFIRGTLGFDGFLVLAQIILILLYRLLIAVRYQLSWESVVLHPLSTGLMLVIAARSGLLSLTKKGYQWKGRNYQ